MADPAAVGKARDAVENRVIRVALGSKRFGDVPVLGEIGFAIAKGETVALVGPSGVGKTTLLRIVAGIDPEFEGVVERPDNLAMAFQEPNLLPWRDAVANLRLVHPGLDRAEALDALDQVGLAGKEAMFPGQLSLGQQRRLALARAFAGHPEFLVMDEPFASLDAATSDAMLSLAERLVATYRPAVLFVTHSRSEAERLADRVLRMRAGKDGATLAEN